MHRQELVADITRHRIIAILRGLDPEQVPPIAEALYAGGIRLLEITFNQNSATKIEDTTASIRGVITRMGGKLRIGAGTVLSVEEAEAAAEAGASFLLAPDTNREVIEAANRLGLAAAPGAMTPTEIAAAYRYGAAVVKVFPTGNLGTGYLRAVRAPLNHIPLIAVGGVDLTNMSDFLAAGVIGFGIGANIVPQKLVEAGQYEALTALAREYVSMATNGGAT